MSANNPQSRQSQILQKISEFILDRSGGNLAVILEIAAMNNRQKKMGYNTAEEFNKRLMGIYEGKGEDR